MGKYIYIGPKCEISGRGGIEIQDYTILGPEVLILSSMHNYKSEKMIPYDDIELLKPVVIETGVWIGMRAIIMPGVHLGKGCVVASGSVVTKSFLPGSIIGGNPAKLIGQRNMDLFNKCLLENKIYLKEKQLKGLEKNEILCE